MPQSHLALCSVLFSLACSSAISQSQITDPGAKQICASVEQVELPAADRPTAAEEKSLANCASVDAYYGFGQPADPVKARKCAYAEMDRGAKSALSGKAILAMVYANGQGVARNYDVALKLSCTMGDAPGDAAGRIHQIDRMKKSNLSGYNFKICDHSSGRDLYEQCAILQERFDKIERDQQLQKLTAGWSGQDKKAFHTLWSEAERFFKVQASNAVNLEGTFEVQEEASLIERLLSTLEGFERGELPRHSADELQRAQAAERAAFMQTQNGSVSRWGTVTRESVKTSEDEWRRYCDAWISFGRQKYPRVTEQSWKVWLSQDRTAMLNRLLH
ncbi:MAG: hypothetical protein LAO78_05665 [Acidobacteriia bacterium]|nr:hypothetical protein [Terriglobia bacterium]